MPKAVRDWCDTQVEQPLQRIYEQLDDQQRRRPGLEAGARPTRIGAAHRPTTALRREGRGH